MDMMKWLEKQALYISSSPQVTSFKEAQKIFLRLTDSESLGELGHAEQAIIYLSLHYNVPGVKDFAVNYLMKRYIGEGKRGWNWWISRRMLKYLSPLDENLASGLKGSGDERLEIFANQCILRDWQKENGIKDLSKSDFPSYVERINSESKYGYDDSSPSAKHLVDLIAKDIAFNREDLDYSESDLFGLISEISKNHPWFPRRLFYEICADDDVYVLYAREGSNINLAKSLFVFLLNLKNNIHQESILHNAPYNLNTLSQNTKDPNLDIIRYLTDRRKEIKDDWFFDSYIGHSLSEAAKHVKTGQSEELVKLLDSIYQSNIVKSRIVIGNFTSFAEFNNKLSDDEKREIADRANFYFNPSSLIDAMKESKNRDFEGIKELLFHRDKSVQERVIREILPLEFQSIGKKLSYMPLFEKFPDETKVVFIDALGELIPQGYLMQFIITQSNEVSNKAIEAMKKIGLGNLVPKRDQLLQKRMRYRKEDQQPSSAPQSETETEI